MCVCVYVCVCTAEDIFQNKSKTQRDKGSQKRYKKNWITNKYMKCIYYNVDRLSLVLPLKTHR